MRNVMTGLAIVWLAKVGIIAGVQASKNSAMEGSASKAARDVVEMVKENPLAALKRDVGIVPSLA